MWLETVVEILKETPEHTEGLSRCVVLAGDCV